MFHTYPDDTVGKPYQNDVFRFPGCVRRLSGTGLEVQSGQYFQAGIWE